MTASLMGTMDALYTACGTIFVASTAPDGSPVYVSYGDPGQYQPSAIVAVMDCGQSQNVDRPTLSTNRTREMVAEISVLFSVYTPGGPEAYQPSLDSCTALVRLLEDYFRVSPNEHLGGACRDAWVSAISGPTGSIAYDPQSMQESAPAVMGRVVEATATVTAIIRY